MTPGRTPDQTPGRTPDRTPRLSIGLPVYNGETYLEQALDGLLAQSYSDFELIVSDNASTDGTAEILRRYTATDPRIRVIRQPHNIGASGNHNAVAYAARGELFKWASHDDEYAPDLLGRCIAALDAAPGAVAAHSWTAMIDESSAIQHRFRYGLRTTVESAPERFRSLLFDVGGDDFYGVIPRAVLRKLLPYQSFYRADRVFTAALVLHGPFRQVPDWLYFRRDRADRATRTPTIRAWCAVADPRRDDPLRHPAPRLITEYIAGYVTAIRSAALTSADRRACYRHLADWLSSRARPSHVHRSGEPNPESVAWPATPAPADRSPAEPFAPGVPQ